MGKETTENFSLTIVRTGSTNSKIGFMRGLNRDGIRQMNFMAEQLGSSEDNKIETIILTGPSIVEQQSGMIIKDKIGRNVCGLGHCNELSYNEDKLNDCVLEEAILNLVLIKMCQDNYKNIILVVGENIACLFPDYFSQYVFGKDIDRRIEGPKEGCAIKFHVSTGKMSYIEQPMAVSY